jgi:adenine-specific DNA-methyltransferase
MARKKNSDKAAARIDAVRHKDKRPNIPTEELRDFVAEEEQAPREVKYPGLLYARDPSLDPQLVWKGKDEQDREELTVPAVPVYIQEKIHPQAIIEDFRRAAARAKGPEAEQLNLFADFNGLPEEFADRVDFYHHEQNWANRLILGDSLLVMTSLAEKEGLKGKVQMIYIDPPYGIKFGSNWQVSTRKRDVKDGKAADATRQPEQIRAFRDTWELGIHSYLAYWRDRLVAARELLTETGSVFVQIGDENVHLVRSVMDEVFGSENFVALISVKKTGLKGSRYLDSILDYVLWYGKDTEHTKYRVPFIEKEVGVGKGTGERYDQIQLEDGSRRPLTLEEKANPKFLLPLIEKGARPFQLTALISESSSASTTFTVEVQGQKFYRTNWKTTESGFKKLIASGRIEIGDKTLRYTRYFDDFPASAIGNFWDDTGVADKVYVVQTSTKVIQRCMLMTTDPGDLVLDPTCGSGTTAYVAEQWGRRWITIDTSRVALALARTRLMAARFPYYLLADSPEGQKKEAEITGQLPPAGPTAGDITKGFVYRRVPHITLKSIANNEEIDAIHAKWEKELAPLLAKINKGLGTKWQEWEVPRDLADESSRDRKVAGTKEGRQLLGEWWRLRGLRQKEIDESIARRAETEMLHDQPYEDAKRVRVTGPFTVESLSPHRTISVAEKKRRETEGLEGTKVTVVGPNQFGHIIIENLKAAGVQNTTKNERLKFDRLEPYAGVWIHAAGEYTEKDGKTRRAAVCIGPEHGTVGPDLVKEAAKEAVQGVGFDLLVVCGFAFDPHVSEEARRYGKLTVMPTKINADLQMGSEFLKKTGAGNLFMYFGEPDIVIHRVAAAGAEKGAAAKAKAGAEAGRGRKGKVAAGEDAAAGEQLVVEILGLDVYDPTTGEVRSHTTDEIACWFIDTDYSGESFFVRHAYFTGADRPYEKLQRALRAEVDEAAWSALYSTVSRPFDPPASGKIAVKVINHYGDEVLKVYEV